MTTRDRSSSSASDHERLDAIRQKANENSTRHPRGWLAVYGADVTWLLDRLAALERERDEEERNHDDTYQKLIKAMFIVRTRAEHAEAALLSLQTALLGLPRYDLVEYADYHEDDRMVLTDEGYWIKTDDVAALLPDPAGTTA